MRKAVVRRATRRALLLSGAGVWLLGNIATPAYAHHTGPPGSYGWGQHGFDLRSYYMPGGPAETWTTGCIVRTRLSKYSDGDRALLAVLNGVLPGAVPGSVLETHCLQSPEWSNITIVTVNQATGKLDGTEVHREADVGFCEPRDQRCIFKSTTSFGPTGNPVFGANVVAASENGVIEWWRITLL